MQTLKVGGSGSYSTIQSAINEANDGDTILVAQGTYNENIIINKYTNIKLQGGWNKNFTTKIDNNTLTIIDGGGYGSVFNINAYSNISIILEIEGFTIQNGISENGGGINAGSSGEDSYLSLTMKNNSIKGNQSSNDGGGVWAYASGTGAKTELTLSNDVISENKSREGGGIAAASMSGGHLTVSFFNNEITSNLGTEFAAGIWLNGSAGSTTMATLSYNIISSNSGPSLDGGGVAAYASDANASTTISMNNNFVTKNSAGYGGGIFFYSWGPSAIIDVILSNNIVACNHASEAFGGISFSSGGNAIGYLRMKNNTVSTNYSTNHPAGGIFLASGGGGNLNIPIGSDTSKVIMSLQNDIIWANIGSRGQNDIYVYSYLKPCPTNVNASYSIIGAISNFQSNYVSAHCLAIDPKFENPNDLIFLLQDSSPAIDAGDPDPQYNDLEDKNIPGLALLPSMGTLRNDMGAYGGPGATSWSIITSVENNKDISTLPTIFELYQNYPNPFNPITTINYSLYRSGFVTIKIFDVIGREIKTLVSEEKSHGNYSLQFDGSNLTSGIYFYQIRTNGFIQTNKMILLK
jgi:hypothetical protein